MIFGATGKTPNIKTESEKYPPNYRTTLRALNRHSAAHLCWYQRRHRM